jgi:peptidoglycan/LPS O-acetylase OafA/YrhL
MPQEELHIAKKRLGSGNICDARPNDQRVVFQEARPNIPALTSLRFFAALLVLIFHYRHKDSIFPFGIANFGYEAVTFFFILSGFILTYSHATSIGLNVSLRTFFTARIARIAPAYYVGLVLALPSFLLNGPWPAAPFVLSMMQAWIPPYALAWNSPAWSISNEIFFYLCYPAIYWLALRARAVPFLCFSVSLILITTIWRDANLASEEWHHLRAYSPLLNLPQFILGVALGNLFIRGARTHWTMLAVGLVSVVAMLTMIESHPWLTNTTLLSLVFSLILLGAASGWSPMLNSRPLFILGDASYAIYILHVPIGSWWNQITSVFWKVQLSPALDFSLYLFVVIVVSIGVLYLIEKPGRRVIQSFFVVNRLKALV